MIGGGNDGLEESIETGTGFGCVERVKGEEMGEEEVEETLDLCKGRSEEELYEMEEPGVPFSVPSPSPFTCSITEPSTLRLLSSSSSMGFCPSGVVTASLKGCKKASRASSEIERAK